MLSAYPRRSGLWAAAVLLGAVATGLIIFMTGHRPGGIKIPIVRNATFELVSARGSVLYALSGTTLAATSSVPNSASPYLTVYAAASTTAGTVVLGRSGNEEVVAVLNPGGTYTPLARGISIKSGLAVRPDGTLAFGEFSTSSKAVGFRVKIVSLGGARTIRDGGVGRPLVALADGRFVVATPAGLIGLDPNILATSSIAANASAVAAVSPSGTRLAAINRTSGQIDLYALGATGATYEYSVARPASTSAYMALGFAGEHTLVALSGVGAELYYIPSAVGTTSPYFRITPLTFAP